MIPSYWQENDLDVNGLKIHYTRTGAGSGKPALLLAHGFSDSGLCWLPVALDLEADFDVILPDAHGHGKSQRVSAGERIDLAGELTGLIKALKLIKPVLGGHSMGASTVSTAAAESPDLAGALVLEDPGWREEAPEPRPAQPPGENPYVDWLKSLPGKSLEEIMAKCRQDSPTWAEIELRPWAESKMQFDSQFIAASRAPSHPWQEVARSIDCPTLLITADPSKGAIVTPEMARTTCELNPRIQVVNIAGAGHNIRRENYPAYMQAVGAFLKSVTA